jgi:hypothetical protein
MDGDGKTHTHAYKYKIYSSQHNPDFITEHMLV